MVKYVTVVASVLTESRLDITIILGVWLKQYTSLFRAEVQDFFATFRILVQNLYIVAIYKFFA